MVAYRTIKHGDKIPDNR